MGSAASSTAASNKCSDAITNDHTTASLPTTVDHEKVAAASATSTTPSSNISSVAQNRQPFTTSPSSLQSGFVMRCPSSPARPQAIPAPPQIQATPMAPDSPLVHKTHSLQAIRTTSSTSSSRLTSVGSTYSNNNSNKSRKSKRLARGEFKSVISEEDRQRAERAGRRQQTTSWGAAEAVFRTGSNRTRHGRNINNYNSSVESGDGGDISPLLVSSSLPPPPFQPDTADSGMDSISKPFQLLPPLSSSEQPQRVIMRKTHSSISNNSSPTLKGERSSSRFNEEGSTHTPPLSIRTKRQDSVPGGATTSSTIEGDLSWIHPTFIEHVEDGASCSRVVGVGSGGGGELGESIDSKKNSDSAKVIHGMTSPQSSPLLPAPTVTSSYNNSSSGPKNNTTTINNNHSFHPPPLPISSPPIMSPVGNNNDNSCISASLLLSGGGTADKIPSIKRRTAKQSAATSNT